MTWSNARDAGGPATAPPRLRLWKDDAWIAIAGPVLVFAGHLLYGAMLPQTALALSLAAAALLGICLLRPTLRKALQRLDALRWPAALYALTLLVAVWSLSPWIPGGPHPVWDYLKISPGAATIDKGATLLEIIKLLGLGCVFLLGAICGRSDSRARLSINVILTLAAALGLWAFFTLVTGNQSTGGSRMEGSFQSANTAGTVFAAAFVLVFGPALSRSGGSRERRITGLAPYAAAALIFLVCVFATASRGAFVAAGAGMVGLGVMMVFGGRLKWSRAALAAAGAAVIVSVLLASAGTLLLDRLLGTSQEFAGRAMIFKVHWQAFQDSPLFGYGLGTFDTVNRMLLDTQNFPKIWSVRAAHNIYLGWLEQAGIVGSAPMFACVGSVILITARNTFRRSRMTSALFALLAVDVVYLTHGTTDFALEMFSVAAMWALLLGLQFGLSQGSSR